MPTYVYICYECGNSSEVIQSINEQLTAPTCICGTRMTRKFFAPPIEFKGKGWAGKE
jgi:putative FmdB family regulatory protein